MINPIWKNPAKILPVDNHPEKKNGVVHGRDAPVVYGMTPAYVASVDKKILTSGVIKNGIAIIGFNTTGNPNVTISLIPKIPGIKANLPSFFIRSDLPRKTIKNTKDNVLPPPPKLPKKSPNGPVKIFGNGNPDLKASKFSVVRAKWIGLNTVFVTAGPLIPKNQNNVDRN